MALPELRFSKEMCSSGIVCVGGGYGFNTWPTAEKGRRLARPFVSAERPELQGYYYVKVEALQALQQIRYKADSAQAPDLFKGALPLWAVITLAEVVVLANIVLIVRAGQKKDKTAYPSLISKESGISL